MKKENIYIALGAAIIALALFAAGYFSGRNAQKAKYLTGVETKTVTVRDTIILQNDTIRIAAPGKIAYVDRMVTDTIFKYIPSAVTKTLVDQKGDSLYCSKRFIAAIDTIIKMDTINARYSYPENMFSFAIKKEPPKIIQEKIFEFKQVPKDRAWWEIPVAILGGAVGGAAAVLIYDKYGR